MHLSEIRIKNFKIFDEIHLKELGQINIFLGDNNIGKTTLLNALLIEEEPQVSLFNLFNTLVWKYNIVQDIESIANLRKTNYMDSFLNKRDTVGIIKTAYKLKNESFKEKEITISILKESQLTKYDSINLSQNTINKDNTSTDYIVKFQKTSDQASFVPMDFDLIKTPKKPSTLPYIPSNLLYSQSLIFQYAEIDKFPSFRNEFIQNLKFMIPDIVDIRINRDESKFNQINIYQKAMDSPIPLSLMGDGAIRTFRVLMKIQESKDKRLMIDEIDNGLHFSRQKDFWISVLNAAKANNVQLFITTHSVECLINLTKAIAEMNDREFFFNETVCFSLFRNKLTSSIDSIRYDYYGFETCINQEIELRS